jgi:EmrB/QacA subfamily drug resistance transporter
MEDPPHAMSDNAGSARLLSTIVVTGLGMFMAALDNLVVTFALPTIKRDLHASVQQLEWTINAYTLTFAVLLLTGAALGDRYGRKRMFTIGLAVFTIASAGAALSQNIESLIAFRALQGAGGAIVTPISLTLLSNAFPAERRGAAIGAWSGIGGLAIAIGPLVGGAIVTGIAWQWIFWVNVPIGVVAVPLAAARLRESFGPHPKLDPIGVVLASAGLFAVVFGVIRGSDVGWSAGQVVGSLAAGVVLLALFTLWQLRSPAPMLPLRFFRSRAFSTINVVALLMYFGVFGSVFLLSQYLQVAHGYSALAAGIRTLPWTGMPMVVAPVAGILTERIGGRPVVATGLALQAASLGWLAAVSTPNVPYSHLLVPLILGGIGMSLSFPPLSLVVLSAVRQEEEGQASGANNAIRELGGVFGIAVLATVFVAYGSYRSPFDFVDGLTPALWVGTGVVAFGALVSLALPGRDIEERVRRETGEIPVVTY